MKRFVAYYSRTKKNKELAKYISEKLNIPSDEIIDTSNRKGYWGFFKSGFATMIRSGSKIKKSKIDPIDQDHVIVCSPIWVGMLPPATRSYLKNNKDRLRDIIFVSISGMGKENKLLKNDIKNVYGKYPKAMLLLTEPEFEKGVWKEKVDEFLKQLT